MRFHHDSKRVFVRQSWLNDMLICAERSRLAKVMPNMRTGSDATLMGTAVHYAIEEAIGCELEGRDAQWMAEVANTKFVELQETETWKETNINPEKYDVYINSMCQAWHDEIAPTVTYGGHVEHKFSYPLNCEVQGWAVWCEGTIDYIDPNGVVYDWKTANRTYFGKDKQSNAVQPTVYAGAVVALGMSDYPVDFRYGIMLRQEKPKAQILKVTRTESHLRWLRHAVLPLLEMAMTIGEDKQWMMNDTSALCSERWCSHWSVCKGAFLSPLEMSVPEQ